MSAKISMATLLGNLWHYRGIIHMLAIRDLRVRYKGSALGFIWTFVNPAITALVYAVVFSTLFKTPVQHYGLYVFAGVIIWGAVSTCLTAGSASITAGANLITRSALPPEIIPIRVVLVSLYNYLLTLPLFYVAAAFYGHGPTISIALIQLAWIIPLIFLAVTGLVLGLALLGALFRDVPHVMSSVTMILFFTTPVMYRSSMLPESVQRALEWSPFTQIVRLHAKVVFDGVWIAPQEMVILLATIVAGFSGSLLLFKRFRSRIAERI